MIAPQRIREGGRYVTRTMPLGPVVHYLYVKEPFRRIGVASYLMRTAGVDLKADWSFTHKTAASTRITKRLAPQATYNPLLARFDKTQTQEALNAAE
jgi:GNAT superfamily N-acetyltransferase